MAGNNTAPSARDFAHILHMTSLILVFIGFPLRRRRNIICALQGKSGGRTRFECSHWALARALEHTGEKLAAEMAAYREIKALRNFQERTGYILFNIIAADGELHRRTRYEDRITPVAALAVEKARRDAAWKANPAKAMEAQAEAAVANLERREPVPPAITGNGYRITGTSAAAKAIPTAVLVRRRTDAMTRIIKCFERVAEFDGPERVMDFAENLATDILHRAQFLAENWCGDESSTSFVKTSGTSSPPTTRPYLTDAARAVMGDGLNGLQICSPLEDNGYAIVEPEMLSAAMDYARRGWAVFPLHEPDNSGICSCSKRENCPSPGKHPRVWKGVNEATMDVRQIIRWWTRWPQANIGLAMGKGSGIVCLDVDPRHGGDASLAELIEQHGDLPETAAVTTGGGGFHLFFQYQQTQFKNSSSKLAAGLDIKTDGGYVVAAPSRHASGKNYVWQSDAPPADMPAWLLKLLSECTRVERPSAKRAGVGCHDSQPRSKAGTDGRAAASGIIGDGARNDQLFRIACAMRGRGAERHEIESEVARVNQHNCAPPLTDDEVAKLVRSASHYAPNEM